jgi:hypothetical protein
MALKSKMILTLDAPKSGCSLLLNHKYDSINTIVHLVKAVSNKGIARKNIGKNSHKKVNEG